MTTLTVKLLKSGAISIRLPLSAMKRAIVNMPALEHYDEASGKFLKPRMTDAKVFARELLHALKAEEEDGTTPVHRMVDQAAVNAIESGAEGILMPDDDGYRQKRKAG